MSVKCSKVLRSALCLMLAVIMALGTCVSALATEINDGAETLRYVSLGDSMTNGYGLSGYDGNNGFYDYGYESYANQFAAWLAGDEATHNDAYTEFTGANGTVIHAPMAMSAMRAEDLHFILEYPVDNSAALAVAEMAEWDEALWNSTFTTGDYYTWNELCDDYRFADAINALRGTTYGDGPDGETAEIAAMYQEAVSEADIISVGIGNGNFGVFMMGRIMEAIGFAGEPEEAMIYDVDVMLRECTAIQQSQIHDVLNTIAGKMPVAIDDGDDSTTTMMEALWNTVEYCVVSFLLNYAGAVEAILQLNDDADIILVGIMNTMAGLGLEGDEMLEEMVGTELSMTDLMNFIVTPVNAYIAALPSAMQATGNGVYADADFYYAAATEVSCIVDTYASDIKTDGVVRDRFVTEIVGECACKYDNTDDEVYNPDWHCTEHGCTSNCKGGDFSGCHHTDGMIWSLAGGLIGGIMDGAALIYITRDDIEAYEAAEAAGGDTLTAYIASNMNNIPKLISIVVYKGFENAVVSASKDATMDIGSFGTLMSGDLISAFNPILSALTSPDEETKAIIAGKLDTVSQVVAAIASDIAPDSGLTAGNVIALYMGGDKSIYEFVAQKSGSALDAETVEKLYTAEGEARTAAIKGVFESYLNDNWDNMNQDDKDLLAAIYNVTDKDDIIAKFVEDSQSKHVIERVSETSSASYTGRFSQMWTVVFREAYAQQAGEENAVNAASNYANATIAESYGMQAIKGIDSAIVSVDLLKTVVGYVDMLALLLALPEVIDEAAQDSTTLMGLLQLFARMLIGNGLGAHPSKDGHAELFDALKTTWEEGYTAQDETIENLNLAYKYAWLQAQNNGYIDDAIEALGVANTALGVAYGAVEEFAVVAELENTKALLLEEIANAQTTIGAIAALLESDDHTMWADYLALKAQLDAHMATIGALAAELNILVTPYLNQIVLAYCEYTALIESISETAYAWLVENSETFAEEYAAWVDAVATAAGEIDPRLEAPIREYLTNTPVDALSILYAYGSEAWSKLLVDASITGGEVYEILAGLNQTLYNHKDEIVSIVENNEDVQALVEDIKALYADLETLYDQMLQAPISTAMGYQETFNNLKGELFTMYGLLVEAVISAAGDVSPELGCALEDSYKALIKALSNAGADSGEYAAWLGEHAGNMAGALVAMFFTNTELLGEQTLPVIGELVANLGEELWGYGSDVYDQVYAFITVCIPNWLGDVKADAIETAEGIWDEVIQPKIDEFITWLITTEGAIDNAIGELYGLLVSYKEQIDEAVAQIESDIRNEIARIEGELEALYEQLANTSGAAREEILAQIAALENELAAKKQELADAVKTALAQIDEDLPGMIDEAYNAFVDAVYEWAKETAPEVADYIYDYLYNNPAEVIGFFREYGDDAVAFTTENIEVFAAVIGFVAITFGDDIADYVMNNPEEVLSAMIGWYKEHGENTWELIKVYLDELGIIDAVVETVTDPEKMKVVFTELLAILQEYGPEMAQEAWDFALEQGYVAAAEQAVNDLLAKAKADLEAWLEDPEGFVNSAASELQAQLDALKEALAACQNELTNEVLAQIAALEAQLESLNEQLLTATGEVKEQIEAAIAVIEAAIEALEAEAAALEADIAAICEQIAAIEEDLAELAEKTAAVGEKLVALVEQAEALKTTLETLAADGLENLEENIDAVVNTISTGIDTIVALSEEVQTAVAAAKDLADDVAAAVDSIITAVDERINGFAETVEAIGATMEAGLAPILEALNALANAAGELSEEAQAQIAALEEEIASILAAAEETAAAIRAEFEEEIAALEQAVTEAAAALEAKKAELESAISEELAARKAEVEAQIADLTAQLEAKKAELEAKMAELEGAAEEVKAEIEAAIAEIEAAIAEIEAAIAEAEAILAEVNAEIQAAVAEIEAAVAELEQALADAEAALNAKIAEVEAAVAAAIAEAEAKAAELQAQIDALIAEAGAQIDEAVKAVAAVVAAELESVKTAVLAAAGELAEAAMNAAEELAAEAAAQAVAAAEALAAEVEEQVLAVGEVIDGYVDEFVTALEEAYEKATTGEYEITETNYYVALGDGSAVSESYVDLLAEELELGEAYVNLAEDGLLPEELLAELAAGNMDYISEIAKADLITVGFSPATFANEQIVRISTNNRDELVEMDWLALVGEEGLPYVEDALAEVSSYLTESGINGDLHEILSIIIESYAYSVVSYGATYAVLVDAIHEISPNAEVILIGSYNAFNDVEFVLGESALPMGEYMEKLTELVNAYMIGYALIAENTTYVDVAETETELSFEGQMVIDIEGYWAMIELFNMLQKFGDTIIPTEDGHEYIKNQILGVETIIEPEEPTGLKGDVNLDGVVDASDVAMLFDYVMEFVDLADQQIKNGDMNEDGYTDSSDVALLFDIVMTA